MKPAIQLHIPTPCHENWDAMTPVAKGKFCSSCSKEVVDFSLLTDAEVLNFFKKATGNTCGKFNSDQLQRPLQETKIEKKKGLQWFLASIASLIMISKTQAQKKQIAAMLGKVAVAEQPKKTGTKGETVVTKNNIPIRAAQTATTKTPKKVKPVVKKKIIKRPEIMGDVSVVEACHDIATIKATKDTAADLSVPPVIDKPIKNLNHTDPPVQCLTGVVGGVMVVTTPKKTVINRITPAPGVVRKILDTLKITGNGFKLYPNPIMRNSQLHIVIKDAGDYQFELFDNNSRLLHAQQNTSSTKNQTVDMRLPDNISAGLYFLRVVNSKTKKTYVDKVIVN